MGPAGPRQSESSASGPAWRALEEVIAHDSDQGQENGVLLEVHLLVPVLIQVAHQLLQAVLIHLVLKARGDASVGCSAPTPTPNPHLLARAQSPPCTGQQVSASREPLGAAKGPCEWGQVDVHRGRSPLSLLGLRRTPGLPEPREVGGSSHGCNPVLLMKKLQISEFGKGKLFNTSENETKLEKFNQKQILKEKKNTSHMFQA